MKIFIDTAKLDEIKTAISWGIIDGVTTNPSLIKKAVELQAGIDIESYIKDILETAGSSYPVSLEVIGLTEFEMYNQAIKLYEKFNPIANNAVIKIPVNPATSVGGSEIYDGLKVIKKLAAKGIPVNCTLIMTPEQALLAAKAGARYVSPFAGRIDDLLRKKIGKEFEKSDYYKPVEDSKPGEFINDNGIISGIDLVEKTVKILEKYGYKTEVIAASLRNPQQAREVALAGADIATIPFEVLEKMISHEQTAEGIRKFTEDIVPEYKKIFE